MSVNKSYFVIPEYLTQLLILNYTILKSPFVHIKCLSLNYLNIYALYVLINMQ